MADPREDQQADQNQKRLDRIESNFMRLSEELDELEERLPDPREFARNVDLTRRKPK